MKTILPFLFAFISLSAFADTVIPYTIKVVDQNGKAPLANAYVRAIDLTKGKTIVTASNDSGYVALDLSPESKYRIDIGKKESDNVKYINYTFFMNGKDAMEHASNEVSLEKVRINSQVSLSNLYFDFGRTELIGADKITLANTLIALRNSPSLVVEIGVHADCNEAPEISAKRVEAINAYFLNKGDLAQRVVVKDYGKEKQLGGCNCDSPIVYTDEVYSMNRVAEFKVISF